MADTDEILMQAVREGDVSKLAALFERHHRVLYDFFARLTGSRTIADDLVQDVFFRILKYRKTYRDNRRFRAWMFHIARNARVDYVRRNSCESRPPENGIPIESAQPLPEQEIEHLQQADLLECALFRLSEEKREVLILSRYEDMKYEEIADLIGCSIGTVKVRVHRALKELREIFFKISREKPLCDVKKS